MPESSEDALDRLRRKLRIDKHALDEEWVEHPSFLDEVGQRHADAVSYRDEAKMQMETVKGQTFLEVRERMMAADKKPTEAMINAEVMQDAEYQKTVDLFLRWSDNTNRWRALLDAARDRTEALKGLVSLHNGSYWASERIRGAPERNDARAERAEEARQAVVAAHNSSGNSGRRRLSEPS